MNKKFLYSLIALILAGAFLLYQQTRLTFSVIIPVYNAEKYLKKCLDSVFAQSGSFEVIAVNDGSTDKSLEILQQYAKKHSNMKIINQQNKGVSSARNAALKVAKNKYITFVDSDDWLEKDAFKKVASVIKKDKSDIIQTGYYDVYDKQWVEDTRGKQAAKEITSEAKFATRKLDTLALFSPFYAKDAHSSLYYANISVHGQFFSNNFIKKHKITFPDGINLAEDFIFIYKAFSYNPLISIIPEPIYDYHNSVHSLSKSTRMLKDSRKSLAFMEQTKEFQNSPRRIQLYIRDNWLSLTLLGIANIQRHGAPWGSGAVEAYEAYKTFNIYNTQERKSCRNLPKIMEFLKEVKFNQPL